MHEGNRQKAEQKSRIFNRIKNIMVYGGMEKDEFLSVHRDIVRENSAILTPASLIATILLTASLVMSFFYNGVNDPNTWTYLSFTLVSAVVTILSKVRGRNADWRTKVLIFVFILAVYFFAIMTTFFNADSQATTIMVAFVLIVQIFTMTPGQSVLITVAGVVIFDIISYNFKAPRFFWTDLWNSFFFGAIAIIMGIYSNCRRYQAAYDSRERKYLSDYDLLTRIHSRNYYERNGAEICAGARHSIICIYGDVNGLHEMNNSRGHRAGDEMLQTVAATIAGAFGKDLTFRFGGDEFVSLAMDSSMAVVEEKLEKVRDDLQASGYHVSFGLAEEAAGTEPYNLVILRAEERMRKNKAEFYAKAAEAAREAEAAGGADATNTAEAGIAGPEGPGAADLSDAAGVGTGVGSDLNTAAGPGAGARMGDADAGEAGLSGADGARFSRAGSGYGKSVRRTNPRISKK